MPYKTAVSGKHKTHNKKSMREAGENEKERNCIQKGAASSIERCVEQEVTQNVALTCLLI